MEPEKVTIGHHTLYLGDCREILPTIGKFDLCLTDPPYGIGNKWDKPNGFGTCGGKLWNGGEGWDKERPDDETINSVVLSSEVSIVWGGNYFRLEPSRGYLVWDKMQTGFSLADSEIAWVSEPITPKTFRFARAQLASEGKIHPTQKPIALMAWCLGFAPDAKTVIDPFMGSGTTGVACTQLGRIFTGIERERKYFDIACERIARAHAQGRIFEVEPEAAPIQEALFA